MVNPEEKLSAIVQFIDASDCRLPERHSFRVWLHDKIQSEREQRDEDGLGNGDLLVRSNEHANCDTGEPHYWNRLLGWTYESDARHYTATDIERLGPSEAGVTLESRSDRPRFHP